MTTSVLTSRTLHRVLEVLFWSHHLDGVTQISEQRSGHFGVFPDHAIEVGVELSQVVDMFQGNVTGKVGDTPTTLLPYAFELIERHREICQTERVDRSCLCGRRAPALQVLAQDRVRLAKLADMVASGDRATVDSVFVQGLGQVIQLVSLCDAQREVPVLNARMLVVTTSHSLIDTATYDLQMRCDHSIQEVIGDLVL